MILVEWVEVRKFLIGGLLLCLSIGLPLLVRRRNWVGLSRYRWLSIPVGLLGILFVMWGGAIVTSNAETDPMYSPDSHFAVRTSYGPFGEPAVELFSMHGLRKEVIYRGDTSSMYWTDSSHLVIEYERPGDYGEGKSCPGSRVVVVRCVAVTRR